MLFTPTLSRIRKGDVVLLRSQCGFIVHRVMTFISFSNKVKFIHKGDASRNWGIASSSQVIGVNNLFSRVTPSLKFSLLGIVLGFGQFLKYFGVNFTVTSGVINLLRSL